MTFSYFKLPFNEVMFDLKKINRDGKSFLEFFLHSVGYFDIATIKTN